MIVHMIQFYTNYCSNICVHNGIDRIVKVEQAARGHCVKPCVPAKIVEETFSVKNVRGSSGEKTNCKTSCALFRTMPYDTFRKQNTHDVLELETYKHEWILNFKSYTKTDNPHVGNM